MGVVIFTIANCADHEDYISQSSIQRISEVEKQLRGGEFWNDGYFVRSVGDKVTSEVIRRYMKY
jgi:putative transposase